MICYLDKTFCKSDCTNTSCHRYFGEKEKEGALKWGGDKAQVAFSDFSDVCPYYTTKQV